MKTITLSSEEIRWLGELIACNPCNSGCILDHQPKYDCYDMRPDFTYKCPLQRAKESISDKIYGGK